MINKIEKDSKSAEDMSLEKQINKRKNKFYHQDLIKFFRYNIIEGSRVLEIGCGTGRVLAAINPNRGVGIDVSGEMIEQAKKNHPNLEFQVANGENLKLNEKFDFVIISDTVGYFKDIQKVFNNLRPVCCPSTRVILNFHNFLWNPLLSLAEALGLKSKTIRLNWLNREDIAGLLEIEDFEIIKSGQRFLFPFNIPIISTLINRYIANLPIINKLCLTQYIIARPRFFSPKETGFNTVSVVIPARNEMGNIENAIKRTPQIGEHTEVIFVEGGSSDDTWGEIQRIKQKYQGQVNIKIAQQTGKGKGDAVRKGFSMATGDVLMILDADLTVPPEDLPKFYNVIASGKGEYINGTRLVYPMEKEAMRLFNIAGNKFFSIMFSWLLSQRLKDTLCGTKVISRKNYQKLAANRAYFGDFDPFGDFDLIFGAAKLNLKIVEVPIRYQAREYGDTNISRFRHGWILLKMTVFAMNKIKFI